MFFFHFFVCNKNFKHFTEFIRLVCKILTPMQEQILFFCDLFFVSKRKCKTISIYVRLNTLNEHFQKMKSEEKSPGNTIFQVKRKMRLDARMLLVLNTLLIGRLLRMKIYWYLRNYLDYRGLRGHSKFLAQFFLWIYSWIIVFFTNLWIKKMFYVEGAIKTNDFSRNFVWFLLHGIFSVART